jgi:hypothetical protein
MIGTVMMIADSAISDRSIGKIADELPIKAGVLVKSKVNPDERGCFSPERMSTCGRKKLFHEPTKEKKARMPTRLFDTGIAILRKILK